MAYSPAGSQPAGLKRRNKMKLNALIYAAPRAARSHMRAQADRRAKAALLAAAREAEYAAKTPSQRAVAAKAARSAALDAREAARAAVEALAAIQLRPYHRSVTPAGYIAHDDRGIIIGSGATKALAWAEMLRYMEYWQIELVANDATTFNDCVAWIHESSIKTAPATQALLDLIKSYGGNCEWGHVGIVACTRDECGWKEIPG